MYNGTEKRSKFNNIYPEEKTKENKEQKNKFRD